MRRLWTSSLPQKSRSSQVAEQSRVYLTVFLFLFSFFSLECDVSFCFRFVCKRGARPPSRASGGGGDSSTPVL
jgi:hypothetical protein